MKKIITALLMTSSLSVSANNAEFTTMQLQQVDEVRTAALKSHLSYELLESQKLALAYPALKTIKKQ